MALKLQTGDSEGVNVVYMYCRFLILRPQIYCFWRESPSFPQVFHASEALYKCKFTGSETLRVDSWPYTLLTLTNQMLQSSDRPFSTRRVGRSTGELNEDEVQTLRISSFSPCFVFFLSEIQIWMSGLILEHRVRLNNSQVKGKVIPITGLCGPEGG